jgi:hypothetical protein|tara:strand:+ start:535 stop:1227 length:693 start_codon:yes stop_codon:yes gene_type:complete
MADEEVTTTDNQIVETPVDDSQEDRIFTKEEYQNLQRKLSAKDVSEKNLKRQLAELQFKSSGSDSRWEATMAAMVDALGSSSLIDTSSLNNVMQQTHAQKQNDEYISKAMGELSDIIGDDNFNTDEKYTRSRDLWYSGRVTEALADARQANSPSTQIDVEQLTRQIRSDIMKDLGRVDTGESTTTSSNRNASSEALSNIDTSRMTVKQLNEHKNALYEALHKETGVNYKR